VLFDPVVRTWEIVHQMELTSASPLASTAEYDELRWCARRELPQPLSPIAMQMLRLL
jgi:hypothetical protein